jgi:tetratricopeptide (TPR) repeat protein
MSAPIPSPRRFLHNPASWFGLLLLGIVILCAYGNSFHGPFIFDDASSIDENPSIKSWRTVLLPPGDSGLTVSGRPLVNLTVAINYALGGDNVIGYHVLNVCIHVLATFALFGLVRRALQLPKLRDKYGVQSWWLALAAAAVWGLHPLQTESVTYVIQRAEALVGLFYLLTIYLFVRSVEQPELLRWKIATVLSCLLGMVSKEVMVTAPVVILLFDRTFIAGSFAAAWTARRRLYLALAATWILLALCIISTGKRGSTVGFSAEVNAWRYMMTQCYAIIHYLKLVFWPNPLVLDYGGPLADQFSDVAWRAGLLCVLVGVSLFLLWRKPLVGFFLVTFFVLLAPTSSIVPVLTQTVAEHRMYLPIAPLAVLLVVGTGWLLSGRAIWIWFAISLALGIRTFIRNHDYRSEEAIWTSVTDNCVYNIRGWNSLAMTHSQNGNLDKAAETMKMAIRVRPNDPDAFTGYANILSKLNKKSEAETYYRKALQKDPFAYDANYNLGVLLLENARAEESISFFKTAIRSRPKENVASYNLGKAYVALNRLEEAVVQFRSVLGQDPKAPDASNNLGNALLGLNQPEEAIKVLQAGLVSTPKNSELHRTLGLALISVGRPAESISHFETAIALDAKDAKAHANLGLALLSLGRGADACSHFESALANPKDLPDEMIRALHVSAGGEWFKLGQVDRAREHYAKAVEMDPANPQLRLFLANLLLRTGAFTEAIPHYEQMVSAAPEFAEAQGELGLAYMEVGRLAEARTHLETALRLQPDNATTREALSRLRALERR